MFIDLVILLNKTNNINIGDIDPICASLITKIENID